MVLLQAPPLLESNRGSAERWGAAGEGSNGAPMLCFIDAMHSSGCPHLLLLPVSRRSHGSEGGGSAASHALLSIALEGLRPQSNSTGGGGAGISSLLPPSMQRQLAPQRMGVVVLPPPSGEHDDMGVIVVYNRRQSTSKKRTADARSNAAAGLLLFVWCRGALQSPNKTLVKSGGGRHRSQDSHMQRLVRLPLSEGRGVAAITPLHARQWIVRDTAGDCFFVTLRSTAMGMRHAPLGAQFVASLTELVMVPLRTTPHIPLLEGVISCPQRSLRLFSAEARHRVCLTTRLPSLQRWQVHIMCLLALHTRTLERSETCRRARLLLPPPSWAKSCSSATLWAASSRTRLICSPPSRAAFAS